MTILTQEAPTKQQYGLPGLRVVRRQHSYHFTVEQLERCCAAHPSGCGYEVRCLELYDEHCDRWKSRWHPTPAKPNAPYDPRWIPILSTRDTIRAIRNLIQEAQ